MEKKIVCADCKHEVELVSRNGVCPKCNSTKVMNTPNAKRLMEALRHIPKRFTIEK